MKKLRLTLSDVENAWDTRDQEYEQALYGVAIHTYLNLKTGAVEYASEDEMTEEEFEKMTTPHPDRLHFPDKWEWPKVDGYKTMEDFIDEVEDPSFKSRLTKALQGGRGVFRRFKDVVHSDVELRDLWRWYEDSRERENMEAWLSHHDIEPQWDTNLYQRHITPDKRTDLCAAVLEFVEKTQKLSGVESIALLGSLTTDKRIPKDVDLLVTINDSAPIETLAKYKRSLLGKTMATGDSCGADVFVCDTQQKYLGRMCSYKDCHPRVACNGRSCGASTYICDDLHIVTLDDTLLKAPPITLWPDLIERVDPPQDVKELILDKL